MRARDVFPSLLRLGVLALAAGCGTQGGNPGPVLITGTQGGNPVSFVLGANSNAQVSALSLCVQSMQLLDADGATPVATIAGAGTTAVSSTIHPLGAPAPVAARGYGGVALRLDATCASGKSLTVANSHGSLAVASALTLKFSGAFTVTSTTGAIVLGVQPIVDQLATAADSAQAAAAAMASSGQATPVEWWRPDLVTSWQIQLTTPVDTSVAASVFVIDAFDNATSVVNALHAQGKRAVCSVSVGTWESGRADAASFPAGVQGSNAGSASEKYLDIRQMSVLGPIMGARFDLCKSKGFDAVAIDNTDGYANSSGFPLTAQNQLDYNLFMAALAHTRGMSVALQGDLGQVVDLAASFDFGLAEQCFEFSECGKLAPYSQSGKPVLEFEYNLTPAQFCAQANAQNLNSLLKNVTLDATRTSCR